MTPETLEYLLRVTVIWLALLAYYFITGRKANFRFQRFFLLGGWLFGLLVPLLPSVAGEGGLAVMDLPTVSFSGAFAKTVPTSEVAVGSSREFADVLPWLYLLGVLFFGARTLVQGWVREQYLRTGLQSMFNSYPVIRHANVRSPFAARGHIFLPATMTDAELEHTALIHESSHLRARHHYDKTLLTLGSILLWFHPLMWAYQRLLATVHEYEADAAVLQQVPARTYGLQLLHCSLGPARGLGLFSSPLKQRIEMITNNTKNRRLRLMPLFSLCILLTGLILACSDIKAQDFPAVDNTVEKKQPKPYDPASGDAYLIDAPDPTLLSEETLQGLIKDISQNVTYPKAAREAGVSGWIRMVIVMNESGMIHIVYYDKNGDKEPMAELVIVGSGESKESTDTDREILASAVSEVLYKKQLTKPSTAEGAPAQVVFALDFIFKLEE